MDWGRLRVHDIVRNTRSGTNRRVWAENQLDGGGGGGGGGGGDGVGGRGGCPVFLCSSEFIPHRFVRLFGTFDVQFDVLFNFHRCDVIQPSCESNRAFRDVIGVLIVP